MFYPGDSNAPRDLVTAIIEPFLKCGSTACLMSELPGEFLMSLLPGIQSIPMKSESKRSGAMSHGCIELVAVSSL
jgi:hypothetical protein